VKKRSGLGIATGGLAAIVFAGATLGFSGLSNGGFESGTYIDNGSGFEQLNAGDTSLTDWTVDAGSVDWISTYWSAPEGAMSIDMSGAEAGTISQTFATTIGNSYSVSFSLSGNPAGPPNVKTLDVTATGGTAGSYTFDATGSTLATMTWTEEVYTFVATSTSSTLTFTSTTASAFGPALDNVVVTETVPTGADCKEGGWQTMIDSAGNHFKNQGDCVSYFATKGKNLGALAATIGTDVAAATDSEPASSPVKHSTKEHDKANSGHAKERPSAKDKTKTKAGHTHGPKSHHHK
jgi:choice-of-anchor C domain-containing protein